MLRFFFPERPLQKPMAVTDMSARILTREENMPFILRNHREQPAQSMQTEESLEMRVILLQCLMKTILKNQIITGHLILNVSLFIANSILIKKVKQSSLFLLQTTTTEKVVYGTPFIWALQKQSGISMS